MENNASESKEPTLTEYNLDISVYKNYREKIAIFEEKLSELEKIQKSLESSFAFITSTAVLFCVYWFLLSYIPYLIFGEKGWIGIWSIVSFWISLVLAGDSSDFVANLISLGKLNKTKQSSTEIRKQIEELKKATQNQVKPFEKAASDYYRSQLRNFFENNLYKKRSGNSQFEEALAEFSSMIEELSSMNSIFITTDISQMFELWEYRAYLEKRTINHNFQSSKKSNDLSSVRSFVRSFSQSREQEWKEVIAPEKLYRTARKIDNWEEINRKRKLTGQKGEEIAVALEQEFFESINRKDLADKIRHVAMEDGDGLGYDVLSFFEDGREKYIEVKSTTTSITSPFYLSRNELGFLKEHSEDALIYRICISGEAPQLEVKTSSEVLEMNEIIPMQYMVRAK